MFEASPQYETENLPVEVEVETTVKVRIEMRRCELCEILYPAVVGQRGRPSRYCGKDCRDFVGAMGTLMRTLDPVREKASTEAWRSVRARFFELCNERAWNKGVKDAFPSTVVRGKGGRFEKKKRKK